MSKPRTTERKIRQRRKTKLASLRAQYATAKSMDAKNRILEKAIKVSPSLQKDYIQKNWA